MLRLATAGATLLLVLLAGPAAAASAPSATTGPVTTVGPTSATVTGSVDPNGTATTWYVEYGTSASYGTKTPPASAGSGTAAVAVSPTLGGLRPGTTYHYRVVATSSAGSARGADGLFSTSSPPGAVTGGASGVTATSATLQGTVDPNGRATSWYFELGTSTAYGTKTAARDAGAGLTALTVSAPVGGLQTGRTYHYRLVAASDAGTTRGADRTLVAAAAPSVAMRAASGIADTGLTLNGSVNPNGQATTAWFEYGTTTAYGSRSASKSVGSGGSSTTVSISIGGLEPGRTYHVRLVASSAAGRTVSADATAATTGPPVARSGPAVGIGYSSATLTGTVMPNGHSTTVSFEYGTTTRYGSRTAAQNAGSGLATRSVAAGISGLAAATTYHYRLVARSSSGTVAGADATFSTAAPVSTISTAARSVLFRRGTMLTGSVSSHRSNESVQLWAQKLTSSSFTLVATVLTGTDGTWGIAVRPTILTVYKAVWNGAASATVTVGVRPIVTLRQLSKGRLATLVLAGRPFTGRYVQLQRRRADGGWRTIGRLRLSRHSRATFHPSLPHGRSTLRIAFSVNQAGAGYLGGVSRPIAVRR
jgi:phosphodiesterase/alkaline phosphatase D-like protein